MIATQQKMIQEIMISQETQLKANR